MGKPKHSNDPRGEQKGAQTHDEGQYGPKAYQAKWDEITDHSGSRKTSERDQNDPAAGGRKVAGDAELHERIIANPEFNADGGHRLFENRKQHDEAEKNSEKNRRDIDMRRHGHDPAEFQGRGGHTAHPEGGDTDHSANIRSTGQGGGNRSDADRGNK